VLLDDVTWRLGPGDRVGLVGVNGSGKSTLLRLVAGQVEPASGRVRRGRTVKLAFLTQEVRELEALAGRRVVQAVRDVRETTRLGDREVTASQLAERLGFTGPRQQTLVRDLSGGERRRLQLLRLLMDEPNVLLLDEPTNDLDVDTLTALEDLLDGWAGTLIVVSHDRYALERMCDRQLALLGDGRLRDLPGGVDEYLRLRAAGVGRSSGDGSGGSAATRAAAGAAADGAAASAPSADAVRSADPAAERAARKEMARVERQLNRLSEQEAALHAAMAEQAADHVAVADLDAKLRALHAERDDLEARWLEAADVLG
jgi:ATP-binding cassette subfamily F protein uup